MTMKRIVIILCLVIGFSSYGQDPQTNSPSIIYPLLDEYIKEGFDRNHRFHTRKLHTIDFIYLIDITRVDPSLFHNQYGNTSTYKVYRYYHRPLGEWHYVIAINYVWMNNYTTIRRIFFKAMGISQGLYECHDDCKHIMSKRPLFDPILQIHDLTENQWEEELTTFYIELSKKK